MSNQKPHLLVRHKLRSEGGVTECRTKILNIQEKSSFRGIRVKQVGLMLVSSQSKAGKCRTWHTDCFTGGGCKGGPW